MKGKPMQSWWSVYAAMLAMPSSLTRYLKMETDGSHIWYVDASLAYWEEKPFCHLRSPEVKQHVDALLQEGLYCVWCTSKVIRRHPRSTSENLANKLPSGTNHGGLSFLACMHFMKRKHPIGFGKGQRSYEVTRPQSEKLVNAIILS